VSGRQEENVMENTKLISNECVATQYFEKALLDPDSSHINEYRADAVACIKACDKVNEKCSALVYLKLIDKIFCDAVSPVKCNMGEKT
jgi:hypothetical protein